MDVVAHIKELCQEREISYYKLAKESNLAYSSISNMLTKGTTPSVYTLEKICKGLDITLAQFFDTENNYIDLTENEYKLLEIYSGLPKYKKELLLAYAEGLSC